MIPLIQAKSSFQDALLFIKSGMHLAGNAASAKGRIAEAIGLPKNVPYGVYAYALGVVLAQNNQENFVKKMISIMGMGVRKHKLGFEIYALKK